MGKKQGSSSAPAPPPPPPPEDPTKRKPKGHRQRGAGTIISAPKTQVTDEGLVLAPHMRLPSTLVNEFCQREKRPKPLFFDVSPNFRCRIVLKDAKNTRDDLEFLPVQAVEQQRFAKEYASLLALYHFQPTLPLERKLPEPFAAAWLDMVREGKRAPATAAAASGAKKAAAAATTSASSAVAGDSKKLEAKSNSTSASDTESTTSSSASAPKLAPVLGLRSATRFVSNSAKQASQQHIRAERNRRRTYFEAFRRANKPMSVFMSQRLRAVIESALGIQDKKIASFDKSGEEFVSLDDLCTALQNYFEYKSLRAVPLRAVSLADQLLEIRSLFDELVRKRGFPSAAVLRAFASIFGRGTADDLDNTSGDDSDEDDDTGGGVEADNEGRACRLRFDRELRHVGDDAGAARQTLSSMLRDYCMEYLCLHLDGDELPEAFDAQPPAPSARISVAAPKASANRSNDVRTTSATQMVSTPISTPPHIEQLLETLKAPLRARAAGLVSCHGYEWGVAVAACLRVQVIIEQSESGDIEDKVLAKLLSGCSVDELSGIDSQASWCDATGLCLLVAAECEASSQLATALRDSVDAPLCTSDEADACLELIESEKEVLASVYPPDDADPLLAVHSIGGAQGSSTIGTLFSMKVDVGGLTAYLDVYVLDPSVLGGEFCYPNSGCALPFLRLASPSPSAPPSATLMRALPAVRQQLWARAVELKGSCAIFQLRSDVDDIIRSCLLVSQVVPQATLAEDGGDVAVSTGEISVTEHSVGKKVASVAVHSSRNEIDRSLVEGHPFWHRAVPSSQQQQGRGPRSGGARGQQQQDSLPVSASSSEPAFLSGPKEMIATRRTLPAWQSRGPFIDMIESTKACIVTGETGCGKTTQIPQFILERHISSDKGLGASCPRVLCCQPRRLAAVGVATRVAAERGCKIGEEVGYMVRGDCKASAKTRLLFCTYGVLLRRLQHDIDLSAIDYVIFDEVHERGLESDFALTLLLDALQRRNRAGASSSPPLHLILMSATIQTDKFVGYLDAHVNQGAGTTTPVLHIPGYTFPVQEFYRGDFETEVRFGGKALMGTTPTSSLSAAEDDGADAPVAAVSIGGGANMQINRNFSSSASAPTTQHRYGGFAKGGGIDFDLIVRLILQLSAAPKAAGDSSMLSRAEGAVLVFMPGVPEINKLIRLVHEALDDIKAGEMSVALGHIAAASDRLRIATMALHGNLSPSEQARVFEPAGRGSLKIVVATNVAEASVTIPDVTVVIDCCKVKEMTFDPETQMPSLVTGFASKDSMRQRRGRAGRVAAGRCFRVVHARVFDSLPQHSVPEILRSPLDRLVLQVAVMLQRIEAVRGPSSSSPSSPADMEQLLYRTLQRCPDAPPKAQIDQAVQRMRSIDAMTERGEGGASTSALQSLLTPLGEHIVGFPCSPVLGKLLLYGAILGCAAPVSAIAACVSVRDPFLSGAPGTPEGEATQALVQAAKQKFSASARCGLSDHLILAEVVRQFRALAKRGSGGGGGGAGAQRQFCSAHGLSYDRMLEVAKTQEELLEELEQAEFISSTAAGLCEDPEAGAVFSEAANGNCRNARVVIAALCAGMYPQVCSVVHPPKKFVDTAGGSLEKTAIIKDLRFYVNKAAVAGLQMDSKAATARASSSSSAPSFSSSSSSQAGPGASESASARAGGESDSDDPEDSAMLEGGAIPAQDQTAKGGNNSSAGSSGILGSDLTRVFLAHSSAAAAPAPGHNYCGQPARLLGSRYLLYSSCHVTSHAYVSLLSEVGPYPLLFFSRHVAADYATGNVTIDGWIKLHAPGRVVALVSALRRAVDAALLRKVREPGLPVHAAPEMQALVQLMRSDGGAGLALSTSAF